MFPYKNKKNIRDNNFYVFSWILKIYLSVFVSGLSPGCPWVVPRKHMSFFCSTLLLAQIQCHSGINYSCLQHIKKPSSFLIEFYRAYFQHIEFEKSLSFFFLPSETRFVWKKKQLKTINDMVIVIKNKQERSKKEVI